MFGAVGLAFNIFTRWVHTSPFILFFAFLIYRPRSLREYRLVEISIALKQLFKRLQESATEWGEPFHTTTVLASISSDSASANLLAIAPECGRFRDHLFRVVGAVLVCVGSYVRPSSGEDYTRARHEDRVSFIGLHLDMERNWCLGCQSAQDIWLVSFDLLFVLSHPRVIERWCRCAGRLCSFSVRQRTGEEIGMIPGICRPDFCRILHKVYERAELTLVSFSFFPCFFSPF